MKHRSQQLNSDSDDRSSRPSLHALLITAIASLALTACGGGGGGDDAPELLADVQGRWVSTNCAALDDNQSLNEEFSINGNTAIQTQVRYLVSTTCSGNLKINTNITSTLTVSGETTDITGGVAKHADITVNRAYITASDAAIAVLDSQGTTLQDAFTAQGIADIDNIPLSSVVDQQQLFTIYQVTGNQLRVGDNTVLNDGSTAEARHTVLDPEIYVRQ